MFVMRVETPDGYGPYRGKNCDMATALIDYYDPEVQPVPDRDIPVSKHTTLHEFASRNSHYGFADAEQLRSWMPDHVRQGLVREGYVLSVYEVPDDHVFVLRRQAMFHRDVAKLVAHIDPERFLSGDLNMWELAKHDSIS